MAVAGNAQLRLLGLKFQAAGAGGLRRNLLAGIRAGAKPLVDDVRAAAREDLPKKGGLAAIVAESPIAVRTRLTGPSVGVRIVNTRKGVDTAAGKSIRFGTDTGRLRHPVFGHRDRWVTQQLRHPGWFTETLAHRAPETTPFVLAAMEVTAREIMLRGL